MKNWIKNTKVLSMAALIALGSCESLDETNNNPNGVSPADANVNMLMPTVMSEAALNVTSLGYQNIAGVVQHTQKDGWFDGHNSYNWGPTDWSNYYNMLRTNEFMIKRSEEVGSEFHKGIGLTMKSFLFGMVTDLWGDAPYTYALQGSRSELEYQFPVYDSQETIYKGVIEDLKTAASIFASTPSTNVIPQYDIYFGGNAVSWQKFANSLLLRYYMRISDKLPEIAKPGIEAIYNSGLYIKDESEDVTLDYLGASSSDSWPSAASYDAGSNFRRLKPANTLLNPMLATNDPRVAVWFRPVHCQWVEDLTLTVAQDPFIRKNGVIQEGVVSLGDEQYIAEIAAGNKFTRHYNPNILGYKLDTREYVGLPTGLINPSAHNSNPTPGQQLENQHVSQIGDVFRLAKHDLLKARIISAAEVNFILAEAAIKGYAVGNAEAHYLNGINASLKAWGVADGYDQYVAQPGVAFDGSVKQIITQKWIASWTAATEAWFDYRRTGFPEFQVGPASMEPVMPVRFPYGNNELNYNAKEVETAVGRLQTSQYGAPIGPNNQWAKPWVIQGTNKPW